MGLARVLVYGYIANSDPGATAAPVEARAIRKRLFRHRQAPLFGDFVHGIWGILEPRTWRARIHRAIEYLRIWQRIDLDGKGGFTLQPVEPVAGHRGAEEMDRVLTFLPVLARRVHVGTKSAIADVGDVKPNIAVVEIGLRDGHGLGSCQWRAANQQGRKQHSAGQWIALRAGRYLRFRIASTGAGRDAGTVRRSRGNASPGHDENRVAGGISGNSVGGNILLPEKANARWHPMRIMREVIYPSRTGDSTEFASIKKFPGCVVLACRAPVELLCWVRPSVG